MKNKWTYLIVLFFTVFLISGCEILGAIGPFESSLRVSQGDYPTHIQLTWSSNFGEGEVLNGSYSIYRSPVFSGGNPQSATSTNYSDNNVIPGITYSYYIEAAAQASGSSPITTIETGYAMDSRELLIYSHPSARPQSVEAGPLAGDTDWFEFVAQKGWHYHFKTSGTALIDTWLNVYDKKDLELNGSYNASGYGQMDWSCTSSGDYYLEVGSDTSSSHFFLNSWHD